MTTDPSTTGHACRANDTCRNRVRDYETGNWLSALTIRPRFLCQGCIGAVTAASAALWEDYLALHRAFEDTSITGPTSGRPAASPTPPVPVNVHTDALMGEIADTAHRCAVVIAERLGLADPHERHVGHNLDLIENNIAILLDVPEHDAMGWLRGGEQWAAIRQDGVSLALGLVDLHRRASATLGVSRGRDRMPLPCPRCEESQLGRWHGAELIDCLACGAAWTEFDYRRMTTILATDYQEFA
ncbi:hypothetical protein NXT08_22420 [Rhodococcus pyridinivorans]|uniref:hypothetical protein n=1 Tax=Rhodococcus pyridinivorans TaxID=103816 RepID=UPI000BA1E918|nr:hypothetical protein [Rhodococcus pyridinivorans]UVT24959.1 hypothetical protein NXT08_22420 [Rhodococcus pyridinivorans]